MILTLFEAALLNFMCNCDDAKLQERAISSVTEKYLANHDPDFEAALLNFTCNCDNAASQERGDPEWAVRIY